MQCDLCGIYLAPFQECPRCLPSQLEAHTFMNDFNVDINFNSVNNQINSFGINKKIHSKIPLVSLGVLTTKK